MKGVPGDGFANRKTLDATDWRLQAMTNSQLESARMVTPEAVALEFRTANLGSRILAYLIDMVVVVAGILAGLFAVALLGQASDVVVPDWVALTIVLVLLPAWWLGYFIAFETLWRGRTLGKAALGLRVVTKEGAPVRFRHAAIRGLLGLVDFLVLGGFLAVVFILFTRDNQRLGDLVAGTLVLRERSCPGRSGAGQLHAPAGAGALHRHPRPERGRQRGVPGGADVPAAGAQPVARSPLGAGPAAGQPAGGPAAPAATGRHLPRALPPVRGRRLPAAPAPGRSPHRDRGVGGAVDNAARPVPGRLASPSGGPSPEPGR